MYMAVTRKKSPTASKRSRPPDSAQPASTSNVVQQELDRLNAALQNGAAWPEALLEAVGRWPLPYEEIDGVRYQYLLLDEAFDWIALAGRLLTETDGAVPDDEKYALLFNGRLPQELTDSRLRDLMGPEKYRAHLNHFYGVVVEEALLLAVEEEIHKEHTSKGMMETDDVVDAAYRRLYRDDQVPLLELFRAELGRPPSESVSLTELKEFTYWLFKRRLNSSDSARVASDTKKGLLRLLRLQRD